MTKKRIIVGVTGASGAPLALRCLREIKRNPEFEAHLIITRGAAETIAQECGVDGEGFDAFAGRTYDNFDIGANVASGTFETVGMLVVPCSMKTAAGIAGGFADNLLLRAADVTIKEKRPLVLAARETPMSRIHLRNLAYLSELQNVWIVPPVLTYYTKPQSIEDMEIQICAKLLKPFGIEAGQAKRWEKP